MPNFQPPVFTKISIPSDALSWCPKVTFTDIVTRLCDLTCPSRTLQGQRAKIADVAEKHIASEQENGTGRVQ